MIGELFFSVIVPTYNRPRRVAACLESVLAQAFPVARYEVIVVDDGSRARARRALARYVDGERVRLFRQRRSGWGAARLLGARHARGDILAFIDDDCVAPAGWLACYARTYAARPDVGGVAGGLRPGGRMNVAGRKQYAGHLAHFDRLNEPLGIRAHQAGRAWFTFGGNRTFRREVWLAAQPDEPMWYWDDYAIDLSLRDAGVPVIYEPEAWVAHHYVLGVAERIRAAYRYGRSERRAGMERAPAGGTGGLAGRWRRLRAEVPEATAAACGWYAATQPLAWIARRVGRGLAR
jgi:glycosyltransferase involved in cell wall biosynthesis